MWYVRWPWDLLLQALLRRAAVLGVSACLLHPGRLSSIGVEAYEMETVPQALTARGFCICQRCVWVQGAEGCRHGVAKVR